MIKFRFPKTSRINKTFAQEKIIKSFSSKADLNYDVAVIGAGPGGYVAAIKASQLGLKTVCIEKRKTLGGTCLNIGCIPSKALLNSSHLYHNTKTNLSKYGISVSNCTIDIPKMQAAKSQSVASLTKGIEMLFRKNKVAWISGSAKFSSPDSLSVTPSAPQRSPQLVKAKHIIIAAGSQTKALPGLQVDEVDVLSSTGALELQAAPRRLLVVGAGVIGLELGSVWSRLGSQVTVVEFLGRVAPGLDAEVAAAFTKTLRRQGLSFRFSTGVRSVERVNGELKVLLETDAGQETVFCDKVLVAVGRKAAVDGLGLETVGIKTEKGLIKTDADLKTNLKNVFAIGDVTKGPQLAHKAEEEGIAVAEMIAGQAVHLNYDAIPSVVYTNPEVAAVGKTEEQLKRAGIDYNKSVFPFLANSRAKTVDEYEGFVKILADKRTDKLLGMHIIGEQAGDLIQEGVLALNYGGSSEDIARTCHAHPTRSEAIKEAALAAHGKAIHF